MYVWLSALHCHMIAVNELMPTEVRYAHNKRSSGNQEHYTAITRVLPTILGGWKANHAAWGQQTSRLETQVLQINKNIIFSDWYFYNISLGLSRDRHEIVCMAAWMCVAVRLCMNAFVCLCVWLLVCLHTWEYEFACVYHLKSFFMICCPWNLHRRKYTGCK